MAEDLQKAIEYTENAGKKVDTKIAKRLEIIENDLKIMKCIVEESKWESKPLKPVSRHNTKLFEFALDTFENRTGYDTFDSTEAHDIYKKYGIEKNISSGWAFTLFQKGVIERKRTVGKTIYKKIFDYRFRKEGIEFVKRVLNSSLSKASIKY